MRKSIHHSKNPKISHSQPLSNSNKDLRRQNNFSTEIGGKRLDKYLGIDFGKSKIGLALADVETRIAFAHSAIRNDRDLLANLEKIIEKENVATVIIGMPSYILETSEEADQKSLGKLLEINAGVQVEYFDEMFTTKMAQANLKEKGARKISQSDDKEAARIILQEWLDRL